MAASPASIAFGSVRARASACDRPQPRDGRGGAQWRVRCRERRRTLGRRTIGQPPHLGEALRARLGLEEIPAEDARQPQRLRGQTVGGVLRREVVQPEADGNAVDRLAAQGRLHALAPGHHLIAYGLIGVPTARVTGSGGATRRKAYRPSAAQSAASSSRKKISPSVSPMLAMATTWNGL